MNRTQWLKSLGASLLGLVAVTTGVKAELHAEPKPLVKKHLFAVSKYDLDSFDLSPYDIKHVEFFVYENNDDLRQKNPRHETDSSDAQ